MATVTKRGSGTPTTTNTTWASLTNAVDGAVGTNPATNATWTNGITSAVATIEIGGYDFASAIGAADTLTQVQVAVRHLCNNVGRITSVQYQPYDGATPLGTIATGTLNTAAHTDTATFTCTLAQLRSANFKVRVTVTHAANVNSLVFSLDHADVIADYTVVGTPPTVALNSPAHASGTPNTTPTLDFTGTDAEGNDVRYNVQIAQPTLIESFDEGGWTWGYDLGAVNVSRMGQSFTAVAGSLESCKFRLENTGSPTGNLQAALYAHAGTFGDSSVGTGTALATSGTVNIATVPTGSSALITFVFPTPYTLTAGTKYVVAVEYSGGDASNFTNVLAKATDPPGLGNASYYYSGAWTALGSEVLGFYVYEYTAIVDKVSGTDAGFVNPDVGGDTDPFTSGHNIQYTVQSGNALALGNYAWRVRGIDPGGFNAYGAWTSYQTFTVTLPPPHMTNRIVIVRQAAQRAAVM